MGQGLEIVDGLLDLYQQSNDKKLLSDATVKMNDLYVSLRSRANKEHVCAFLFSFF